jgi:hypothetical protein
MWKAMGKGCKSDLSALFFIAEKKAAALVVHFKRSVIKFKRIE